MANKAFEIQNSTLRIGGVDLEAGTTGVVIPGVTAAVTFRVEEVDDRENDANPDTFQSNDTISIIDNADYLIRIGAQQPSGSYVAAGYSVDELDDGEIKEINVEVAGVFTGPEKANAVAGNMWATAVPGAKDNFDADDWVQIAFRPKFRADEVVNVGGGGADLGDFTIDGSTLEADSMTIRTVDDDMTLESDSDLFVNIRNNGSVTISDQGGETFQIEPTLGKITFPDNSEQTTAYTGEDSLAPLLTKTPGNTLELNAEIIMTQDVQGIIAAATGDYNFDVEFNAATGDAMGNTYAVGQADGARFIMAFNPDATLKWAKEVAGDADFESSATLQNIRYDGENNEILVGYNCAGHTGIARINPGDGSIISSQRIISLNSGSNLQQSVFVQDNNGIFVGGEAVGERTRYSNVPAQAGTSVSEKLVVNWADVGSPSFISQYYTNFWFIDTQRNGTYTNPSTMCIIEGLQPQVYPLQAASTSILLNGNFNGGLNSWTTTTGQFSVIDGQLVTNDTNSVLTQNIVTPSTGTPFFIAGQYIAGTADSANFKLVRTDTSATVADASFSGASMNEYRFASFQLNSYSGEQYVAEINVQNGAGWMGDNFVIFPKQNILTNGNFFTGDATGWNVSGGPVTVTGGNAVVPDGTIMDQTLTVIPGATYIVRVVHDGAPANATLHVTDAAGTLFVESSSAGAEIEGTFSSANTSVTVTFTATGTAVIKEVIVTLIPGTEPVKSGMTVSVAYGRDQGRTTASKWYYDGVNTTNVGSNYVVGDFLRIPGSQLDGTDSDFIYVPGGSYTVETVGSNTILTFVTADYPNMELLNITDFRMWGKSIYGSPNGPWDLGGNTVTRDATNTYLTFVGNPNYPITGDLVFVDLVNGNDIWGMFLGGIFNYYNGDGAPSLMKVRFRVPPTVDFTIAPNWDIEASLESQAFITKTFGADPLAGEYSVANGDLVDSPYFQFVPMSDPPMITGGMGGSWGGRLAANIDDLVGKTITITTTDWDGVSNPEIVITTIVGHTTSPGYSIQLGPEAINATQVVRRVDSFTIEETVGWSRTLGNTDYQKTHSVATSIARNEVYMLVEDASKVDRVNLLVLDYDTGQLLWQRSISNGNARGGEPGTVLASGDFVYIVSTDGAGRAMVTKLDMANEGALVWQRVHDEEGGNWDGRPVAAFASDGNIVVAGVFYEDVDENDDVLGFWKLNAETGAMMFKTYVVDRQEDDDFFEYAENQCQPFSIVNGYMYYGAYSDDDDNDYNIGVAVKIKDDGTGFGQYGRWEYMANPDPFTWIDNTDDAELADQGLVFVDEMSVSIEAANIVLAGDLSANRNMAYQSELIGRPAPKITFPDESELSTAGIGRHSTDAGANTFTLASAMNGKFIYFNSPFNGAPSTIIVPPNTTTPLPIGFTVTLAVGEFGGQAIYVNNDSINVGPAAATLYASGSDSFGVNSWQLAGDGKTGLYTIMKIDTNTWMIAGPNVQVD